MIPSQHVRAAFCLSCRELRRHEKRGEAFVCGCGRERGPVAEPLRMAPPVRFTKRLEGRYWDRVDVTPYCWNWTGQFVNHGRHPMIDRACEWTCAKKLSFYFATGCWPKGWLYRTCYNVRCVNPDHLVEGGKADFGVLWRRRCQLRGYKPHAKCRRGHPMTGENRQKNGNDWTCRKCRRASYKVYDTNRRNALKQGAIMSKIPRGSEVVL